MTLIDGVLAFALVLAKALFVASEFALARLRPTRDRLVLTGSGAVGER